METDADQAKIVEAVRTFVADLKKRGGVGLFYFSGHGTQIDGENYLLPVEQFASLDDVKEARSRPSPSWTRWRRPNPR